MNPIIKQLALEAGGSHYPEVGGKLLEKFAELIVRECAKIADTERSNSVGCGYITKTNGMRIKQHFGVDE
jgi:hypothetical protein